MVEEDSWVEGRVFDQFMTRTILNVINLVISSLCVNLTLFYF